MSETVEMWYPVTEEANFPVQVKCYSGFKADERPLSFVLSGRELSVMDIEGSWFEEDETSRERRVCFRVRADDGDLYLLSHHPEEGSWILRRVIRLGGMP
ncbi:hypothetical protein [Candidatus Solincola tengchongensis]|uniref:hypothetical protein n=1 Tax=Candidatus Solincola tengchongensis TaxID=2900693 RepID=UPI00257D615B|nr:hypothetical protein [Candidatus Solincola tengchongensis]